MVALLEANGIDPGLLSLSAGGGFIDDQFVGDMYDQTYQNTTTYNPAWSTDGNLGTGTTLPPSSMGETPASPGMFSNMKGSDWASIIGALGPTALGVAGIGQALAGGGSTTTSTRNLSDPSHILSLLSGLNSQIAQRAGIENQAFSDAYARYGQAGNALTGLTGAISPLLMNMPGMAQGQATALRNLQEGPDQAAAEAFARKWWPNYTGGWDTLPDYLKTEALKATEVPVGLQGKQRDAVAGLTPQAMGQVPGLLDAQKALVDPASQFRMDPQVLAALNQQALGAAQGQLPALNDALKAQIGKVYEGRLQDVNRYVDTGLMDALDRARQMGFAGGMEVFREGAPGALAGRVMAEGVRQRGTLAGQQAQDELALAQALPLLGANLAMQQANIGFSGNAQNRALADTMGGMTNQRLQIPQLASLLEQMRVQTGATLAGAYTTPMSVGIQGGSNLVNLNKSLADSLGNFSMGGTNARLGAMTGALGAGGQTGTTNTPFSLLDAFAPTAQLLGGVGGLLGGMGRMQNPNILPQNGTGV